MDGFDEAGSDGDSCATKMRDVSLALFVFTCSSAFGRWLRLGFDIAFIVGDNRLMAPVDFSISFGFAGNLPVFAGGPQCDLGFGRIGINEMTAAVVRAVVGRISLRMHPPYVRTDIGGEGVGTPLPADTEQH